MIGWLGGFWRIKGFRFGSLLFLRISSALLSLLTLSTVPLIKRRGWHQTNLEDKAASEGKRSAQRRATVTTKTVTKRATVTLANVCFVFYLLCHQLPVFLPFFISFNLPHRLLFPPPSVLLSTTTQCCRPTVWTKRSGRREKIRPVFWRLVIVYVSNESEWASPTIHLWNTNFPQVSQICRNVLWAWEWNIRNSRLGNG